MVRACPDCDSPDMYYRVSSKPAYRCKTCDWEGDDPVRREAYR